jgi:ATP phosphoribosyltransferase
MKPAGGGAPAGRRAGRTKAAGKATPHVLTLALPRGRILDEALVLFGEAGVDLGAAHKARAGRRLIITIPEHDQRVLIVRDLDEPS